MSEEPLVEIPPRVIEQMNAFGDALAASESALVEIAGPAKVVGSGAVVRCGGRVRYQGRWVSSHWFNRYVGKIFATERAARPRKPHEPILAALYLPAIPACGERAETRMVNLASATDRRWVRDISDCYAVPPAHELTTFFPAIATPNT